MNVDNNARNDVDNNKARIDEVAGDAAQAVEDRQQDPLDQLQIERDGLKKERDDLKDLLLRRQAEFDNYRKRVEKERSEYVQYAGTEIVKSMLPILDDFERALKTDCGSPEYAKGVEMIHNRMYETLKKVGLEPIETSGAAFDPHIHEAIERVETSDVPEGTVLTEFQRGYLFKGKLLRAAMVKVAVRA